MALDLSREYVLLLADVRSSSALKPESREKLFADLRRTIGRLNRKLHNSLALRLSISYGDEIAALFYGCKYTYLVMDQLREAAHPETGLRFAVARGRIGIDSKDIRQVGGPVFAEANKGVNLLRTKNRFSSWSLGNQPSDRILHSLTEMSNALIEDMSPYQRQVWRLLKFGSAQKQIAGKLGKFPQSVSEAIRRSASELVIDAEECVVHILNEIDSQ